MFTTRPPPWRICGKSSGKVGALHRLEWADRDGTGVVDQDVDGPKDALHLLEGAGELGTLGNVAAQRDDLAGHAFLQQRARLVELVGIAGQQRHPGSRPQEFLGQRQAQPARAAGDDHGAIAEGVGSRETGEQGRAHSQDGGQRLVAPGESGHRPRARQHRQFTAQPAAHRHDSGEQNEQLMTNADTHPAGVQRAQPSPFSCSGGL
jgi:hypothetical protein